MATIQDLLDQLRGGPQTTQDIGTDPIPSDMSTELSSLMSSAPPAMLTSDMLPTQNYQANSAPAGVTIPTKDNSTQQARADAINASQEELHSGIATTVLPNGQLYLTNVPNGGVIKTGTPTGQGTPVFNLQQRLKDLQGIKDPQEAFNQFATLQGDVTSYLATLKSNAVAEAGKLYELPQLQDQLAKREALDKASPFYHIFMTDSPATAKLREQVDAARQRSEQQANELFARNPEAASLSDTMKIIGTKQLTMLTQDIQNQGRDADKKDLLTSSVNPAMVSTYLAANPGVAASYDPTNPDQTYNVKRQTFLMYQTNPAFKEASDAVGTNNPNSLIKLISSDNPFARSVLIQAQRQSLANGDPAGADTKAQQQVNTMFDLVNSPATFKDAVNNLLPAQAKTIQNEIAAATQTATGKEKAAIERDIRLKYAPTILGTMTTNNFLNNIDGTNWGSAYDAIQRDPILSSAYQAVRTQASKGNSNPQVALPALLAQLKATPNIDQAQAIKNLQQIASVAYQKTNTGLIGKGSTLDFNSAFGKQVASSLLYSLNNTEGTIFDANAMMPDWMKPLGQPRPQSADVPATPSSTLGSLPSFANK